MVHIKDEPENDTKKNHKEKSNQTKIENATRKSSVQRDERLSFASYPCFYCGNNNIKFVDFKILNFNHMKVRKNLFVLVTGCLTVSRSSDDAHQSPWHTMLSLCITFTLFYDGILCYEYRM